MKYLVLTILLSVLAITLFGNVHNGWGRPIEDVDIVIVAYYPERRDPSLRFTETDERGNYRTKLAPGFSDLEYWVMKPWGRTIAFRWIRNPGTNSIRQDFTIENRRLLPNRNTL